MNKMNKKGFTLIEMLVVIAIIAVLVSIIVPVVSNSTEKAKAATDAANLRSIAASVAIDLLDDGEVDNTYTNLPECKSFTATLNVYEINGQVIAVFTSNDKGACGVDYFAGIAEDGTAGTTVTVSGTPILTSATTE